MLLKRIALCLMVSAPLLAQTPAPAPNPDTPTVRVGGTLFTDFTYQTEPEVVDADGNRVDLSSFNIGRAYLNVTGNLNRRILFRVTSDIARETSTNSALAGSYEFRLKFAYAQLNLDEWSSKGTFLRLGMQQTPYNEYVETIYRYRFQGPLFPDREGFVFSSDAGFSGHYNFPSDYGDVHVGVFNGESFSRAEQNDQKSVQVRAALHPLPRSDFWKGLTVGVYYNGDNYVADAERRRLIPIAFLQTKWGTLGFEGLRAKDQPRSTVPSVEAEGYSIWATPKLTKTWELLLRHDRLEPDTSTNGEKTRNIFGVAYWVPNLQRISSAIMLDGEKVNYDNLGRDDETRYAVHLLVNF